MNVKMNQKIVSYFIIIILCILTICGVYVEYNSKNISIKTIHIAKGQLIPIAYLVSENTDVEYLTLKIKYDKDLDESLSSILYIQDIAGTTVVIPLDKITTDEIIDYVCKDKRKY